MVKLSIKNDVNNVCYAPVTINGSNNYVSNDLQKVTSNMPPQYTNSQAAIQQLVNNNNAPQNQMLTSGGTSHKHHHRPKTGGSVGDRKTGGVDFSRNGISKKCQCTSTQQA
jgi:hypothetical protein